MKTLFLTIFFFSFSSLAQVYQCVWQPSSDHPENFFQEGVKFNFELTGSHFKIIEDDFLFRTYTPCWTGSFSSCAFGFSFDQEEDWNVVKEGQNFVVTQNWYFTAELIFNFQENVLTLSGDDGDGVFFSEETFLCN